MKKLKAAKVQRPNERLQSATDRRYLAREAARHIRRADDLFQAVAEDAEASDAQRRWAIKEAMHCWAMVGLLIGDSRRGKMLHLVADARGGKLTVDRGGDYDAEYLAAYKKASRGLWPPSSFADFKKAFVSEWKRRGLPEHLMPTNFSLRRTGKRLRRPLPSDNRGRPKKNK